MNKKFFFHVRRVIITPNELKEMMNKTLDTSFKGGLMITLSQVLYMNQVNYKHYLYKVCKVIRTEQRHLNLLKCFHFQEYYTMAPVVIYFPKNSYLRENISRKLAIFESSGLIKFWASTHMDMKYLNFKFNYLGPKKLSLIHLSGTIQMLVGGLILAFSSFILEIFWHQICKFRASQGGFC